MSPASVPVHPPTNFPRELTDSIISTLICLHDDDPAYQWTHLRHITRFHRAQMEQHFLDFWVPRTSLTIYWPSMVDIYTARDASKESNASREGDMIAFGTRDGWPTRQHLSYDWQESIMKTTFPIERDDVREKRIILRLGEGVLSKGYAGGGITSDLIIPRLRIDGRNLCFDWKMLFTKLFGEEMFMRRFKFRMIEDKFVPTVGATPEEEHQSMHKFLQQIYKETRRWLVVHYRNHVASSDSPFDLRQDVVELEFGYWPHRGMLVPNYPQIENIIRDEESMVYHVPGWESWNVREVARLRAREENYTSSVFPRDSTDDLARQHHVKRRNAMEGISKVSEEELEQFLREKELGQVVRWSPRDFLNDDVDTDSD